MLFRVMKSDHFYSHFSCKTLNMKPTKFIHCKKSSGLLHPTDPQFNKSSVHSPARSVFFSRIK